MLEFFLESIPFTKRITKLLSFTQNLRELSRIEWSTPSTPKKISENQFHILWLFPLIISAPSFPALVSLYKNHFPFFFWDVFLHKEIWKQQQAEFSAYCL